MVDNPDNHVKSNSKYIDVRKIVEKLLEENTRLTDCIRAINSNVEAYSEDLIPEINMEEIQKILKEHGFSVDTITGYVGRRITRNIKKVLEEYGMRKKDEN